MAVICEFPRHPILWRVRDQSMYLLYRADVLARSKHDKNHSLLQRTSRRRCDLVLGDDEWILSLGTRVRVPMFEGV